MPFCGSINPGVPIPIPRMGRSVNASKLLDQLIDQRQGRLAISLLTPAECTRWTTSPRRLTTAPRNSLSARSIPTRWRASLIQAHQDRPFAAPRGGDAGLGDQAFCDKFVDHIRDGRAGQLSLARDIHPADLSVVVNSAQDKPAVVDFGFFLSRFLHFCHIERN